MLLIAFWGTLTYWRNLQRVADQTLPIPPPSSSPPSPSATESLPSLAVIIPAYNEADNIRDCLIATIAAAGDTDSVQIWMVDDQSTDETLAIACGLQAELGDPRLHVLVGEDRPAGSVWVGKNWACTQAVRQISSDYLLFLDADVRLKPGAIGQAMAMMQRESLDLMSLFPAIACGCLAEWLVQPLMASLLMVGFPFAEVSDPASDTVFAAGPFMLFRRTAYDQVGGHAAVASQTVEDVELARRIQQHGLKLKYAPGKEMATVRMYRSGFQLWEGWTKNLHLGNARNIQTTLYVATVMLVVGTLPWLGLGWLIAKGFLGEFSGWDWLSLGLALGAIALHYLLRLTLERLCGLPPRFWWLTGLGGIAVALIAIASIIKTETGWGWTWRGRSLQLPDETR